MKFIWQKKNYLNIQKMTNHIPSSVSPVELNISEFSLEVQVY